MGNQPRHPGRNQVSKQQWGQKHTGNNHNIFGDIQIGNRNISIWETDQDVLDAINEDRLIRETNHRIFRDIQVGNGNISIWETD